MLTNKAKIQIPIYYAKTALFPIFEKIIELLIQRVTNPSYAQPTVLFFSEYCKTCNVLFCFKCIANHRKHDCESIDDKASQVRAKVFNLLTDLEIQEKPLQIKNTMNSEMVQKNKDDARKLGVIIQNHCNRLAETLLREIQEKSKANDGQVEALQNFCIEIAQLQKSVRDLLSEPNSNLIKNYASVINKAEEFDIKYKNCMKLKEKAVSFCSENLIDQCFEEFGKNLKRTLNHTSGSRSFYVSGNYDGQIFRVCDYLNGTIEVSKVASKRVTTFEFTTLFQIAVGINDSITHVYPLFCNFKNCLKSFVILLSDRTALITEYSTFSPINYPECNTFLWPYKSDSTLHWSYWDPETSSVKFTHDEGFRLDFIKCPKVKMSGPVAAHLHFIDESENKIVEFSTKTGSYFEITSDIHQLEVIDCVSVISVNLICVWCSVAKSASLLQRSDSQQSYILRDKATWFDDSINIKFLDADYDITLFPVIHRDNSSTNDPLFALWARVALECTECGKKCRSKSGLAEHKSAKH